WVGNAWDLLLDFAQVHGWVWDVDWKESPEEIIAVVRSLDPAKRFSFDWAGLCSAHQDSETRDFLGVLARSLRPAGEVLVALDRGSDSYPLALLPSGQVAAARQLASDIGLGKIEAMDRL